MVLVVELDKLIFRQQNSKHKFWISRRNFSIEKRVGEDCACAVVTDLGTSQWTGPLRPGSGSERTGRSSWITAASSPSSVRMLRSPALQSQRSTLCVEETLGKGMTSVVRRRGDTKLLMEKLKHNYKLPTMIECNAKHLLFFIHSSFSRFVLCFVYANHSYWWFLKRDETGLYNLWINFSDLFINQPSNTVNFIHKSIMKTIRCQL